MALIWLCVVVAVAGAGWGWRQRQAAHVAELLEPWKMHHVHADTAVVAPPLAWGLLALLAVGPAILDGGLPRSVGSKVLSLVLFGGAVVALVRGRDAIPALEALMPTSTLISAARPVSWSMSPATDGQQGEFGDERFDSAVVLDGDEVLMRSTLGKGERSILSAFAGAGGRIQNGSAAIPLTRWMPDDAEITTAAKRVAPLVEMLRGLQPDLLSKAISDHAPAVRARAAELALSDPGEEGDRNALKILEGRNLGTNRESLQHLLDSGESEIVRCAIRLLGRVGDNDSIAALRRLQGWDEDVEAAAERIIARLTQGAVRPAPSKPAPQRRR